MPTEKKWTAQQSDAINSRGGTLLVSAAAGSGKTAVLVERVVGLITDEKNPCDADRLLVVTFTNAAASEMKERISKRIAQMMQDSPLDSFLAHQQMLLQNAHISTIDSFCLELLRENFEKLDIPSDFRIADENEDTILKSDVLSQILENRYADAMKEKSEEGDTFLALSHLLSSGKDDSLLSETVLRLYNFTRSLDDAQNWLDSVVSMYNPEKKVCKTVWGKIAADYVKEAVKSAKQSHIAAMSEIEDNDKLFKAYAPAFKSDLNGFEEIIALDTNADWNLLCSKVSDFKFERLGSLRKFEDDDLKDRLKAERDGIKKTFKELREGILSSSEEQFKSDITALRPSVECLCDIVRELDREFFAAKLKKGILDFPDLEQLTLKLLTERKNGIITFSAAAKAISNQFAEVLVDEYQDTNPAQDLIFRAVSKNGKNLFMVGDVKQSIYSFRQARPEIFMENAKKCAPYGSGIFPAKIVLGKNFRSRSGVTDSVNFIFERLMSEQFGGVDYGEEEKLICGAEYFPHEESDFEINIIDAGETSADEDGTEVEAQKIAEEIKNLVESGYEIQDKGKKRKVSYKDFCILLRSMAGHAEKYTRALENANIPVYADIASGYLGAYEVMVMISFLRILDNPLQDVPLLSVLLSPVFGFTPDDVSEIRLKSRKKCLYLALLELSKSGDTRFDDFLSLVNKLRTLAAVLTADRLILRICEETGFLNVFEAMPNGEIRRANITLLLYYAKKYEAAGFRGLAEFIRFIDRIDRQKSDLAPAAGISENADVVRIMTVHKSKGLEFPICFLANLSKQFNTEDLKGTALFHPTCGFGSKIRDDELNCRFTTLPREAVKLETRKSMLSEEMRVLYVAMTRAKEKLICMMTFKNFSTSLSRAQKIAQSGDKKATAYEEMTALNPAELVLSAALLHPSCKELRKAAGQNLNVVESDCKFSVKIFNAKNFKVESTEKKEKPEIVGAEKEKIKEEIQKRFSYVYPFEQLSKIPSKVSVSELSHKETADFNANNYRPSFLDGLKLSPTQAGTALHTFMQCCSFEKLFSEESIKEEKERLVKEKYLLPEEGEAVNLKSVEAFASSSLFEKIKAAKEYRREFRFNIEVSPKEIFTEDELDGDIAENGENDEKILLQGMADLIFEDESGVYIVDYKTDRVSSLHELSQRYKIQLDLYSAAVTKILGKNVAGEFIYSFHLAKAIKL